MYVYTVGYKNLTACNASDTAVFKGLIVVGHNCNLCSEQLSGNLGAYLENKLTGINHALLVKELTDFDYKIDKRFGSGEYVLNMM